MDKQGMIWQSSINGGLHSFSVESSPVPVMAITVDEYKELVLANERAARYALRDKEQREQIARLKGDIEQLKADVGLEESMKHQWESIARQLGFSGKHCWDTDSIRKDSEAKKEGQE